VVDAGQLADGGELVVEGGCHSANVSKIITYFRTGSLCFFVSFRRPDAGALPAFPAPITGPEDLRVDDGRVGLCSSQLEQADGRLEQRAATINRVAGALSWNVFINGEPYSYNANGTLDFTGTRFWFATPPEGAGITEVCRGP
jgi:hypothetical protein